MYSSLLCVEFQRIRYNNLSIAASSIRKLFVFVSSALANTQFDIQAISQRLSSIPSISTYPQLKEELHLTEYSFDDKEVLPPQTILKQEEKDPSPKHHSQDLTSPEVNYEAQRVVVSADETVPDKDDLLPVSFSILLSLTKKDKREKGIIRKASSLFLSTSQDSVDRDKEAILEYIHTNEIG